jgi:hypothetical protein
LLPIRHNAGNALAAEQAWRQTWRGRRYKNQEHLRSLIIMIKSICILLTATLSCALLAGCAASSWSSDKYGPQTGGLGGAYGYHEVRTADKTWLLTYNGIDLENALTGFNRRAHELCAQVGLSNYDVSAATGVNVGGTSTSAGTTLPGGIIATASTTDPSQTAYITCK